MVFIVCALFTLSCSSLFAQTQQNGWTIEYVQVEKKMSKSASGSTCNAIISQTLGPYCYSVLWGGNNSFADVTLKTLVLVSGGQNASPSISYKAQSRVSGSLQSSAAVAESKVWGHVQPDNFYLTAEQGNYDITKMGDTQTTQVNYAYDFNFETHIFGWGYGNAYAEGKFIFVP